MSKKRAQSKQKQEKPTNKPGKKIEEESEEQSNKGEQKFSLYALLQLQNGPKSTINEIKKQYRKLVIIYHPDKNQGDQTAKEKFHKLQQAYDILSDPEKKAIYDETGTVGDNFDEKSFQTAYQYYRAMYKKIEKEDIEDFAKKYRHGDMEKEDLIQFYETHQGDMTKLLESIPLSANEDIPRFIQFFEEKIANKELKKYKTFDKTKNKVRELKDQTEEFNKQNEERERQMKELTLAIRNKSNKSFLDALEDKYAPKKQRAEEKEKKIRKTKNK